MDFPERPRIFVFDSPRTCSHLFRKFFLHHPQLGHILEPFLVPSVFGQEGVIDLLGCNEAAWGGVVEQMRAMAPELGANTYREANRMLKDEVEPFERKVHETASTRVS